MTKKTLLENACLILVRTSGPINLGMIARLCGNTGLKDIRLVNPLCEINCGDSRKFANHAKEKLLEYPVFETLEEATKDCDCLIGTSARVRDAKIGQPISLYDVPKTLEKHPPKKYALVFGNESHGLDAHEMSKCRYFIHLDTMGDYYSFNLSHAIGIILYHLSMHGEIKSNKSTPSLAPIEDVERLIDFWTKSLDRFEYFRKKDGEKFEPLFRTFINRMPLTADDCLHLRGMLAQFHSKTFGDNGTEVASEVASLRDKGT